MPVEVVKGGIAVDDRGSLCYLNELPLANFKRVYTVENFSTTTIRAFHGHKIEEKLVLVVSGSATIAVAEMVEDKLQNVKKYTLSERNPQVLRIPPGHANGFRALEPNTKLMFFSSTTIAEASADDYRFPHDVFGADLWKVENR